MASFAGRSASVLLLLLFSSFAISSPTPDSPWMPPSWLLNRDVAANSSVTDGQASAFTVTRDICPVSCDDVGVDTLGWTAYHEVERLSYCAQTMLLDFSLHNAINNNETSNLFRCCTAGQKAPATSGADPVAEQNTTRIAKRDASVACTPNHNLTQISAPVQLVFNQSSNTASVADFVNAAQQASYYLSKKKADCHENVAFAYSVSTAFGAFVGSSVEKQDIAEIVLQQFIASVASSGFSDSAVVQLCSHNRSSRYTIGYVAASQSNVALVQDVVAAWAAGSCIDKYDLASNFTNVSLLVPAPVYALNVTNSSSVSITSTQQSVSVIPTSSVQTTSSAVLSSASQESVASVTSSPPSSTDLMTPQQSTSVSTISSVADMVKRMLMPRGDCSTVQVVAGDGCASLANECGITGDQFTQYNPKSNLCSTLQPGQYVCCSPGTLPDRTPKPYSNGTCNTYFVKNGDTCSQIAAANSLTVDQLNQFNTQTWGWMGCDGLQAAETMCLSTGNPPMPAVIPNANCGPQVPLTPVAGPNTNLSTLNPCPLNACCDKWGQCGVTTEFCTQSQSPTGAPGTAASGQNGCISNCGTDIVARGTVNQFLKIGYFEAYNLQRPCLNQPVNAIDWSGYTHVHLAFATITPSFTIDISGIRQQFLTFVTMNGFKKILSVGGWTFSTDPATYWIFRQAVTAAHRDTLIDSIVALLQDYNLDGIDIDWEYPAEFDIDVEHIPPSTVDDEDNFFWFMYGLRQKLPRSKSISFTAPSSFWYLRLFKMNYLVFTVDYIVYMTYDLHGQWDYSNKWSDPGCSGGNCLRSHVNLTETLNSLSMITKAGVLSSLVVVGVSSYGRSFQMTTPGCTGEQCTYTGPRSGAYAGQCTNTAGYISNAEIAAIIAGNATVYGNDGSPVAVDPNSINKYYDGSSQSNILVYNGNQWVSYMDEGVKAYRRAIYQNLGFLGTADWAVDLQSFNGDSGNDAANAIVSVDPSIWQQGNPTVTCKPPCILLLPPYPLGFTSTVTWPALTTTLLSSSRSNVIVTVTTTINVPVFTFTDVSLQPITVQSTDTGTYTINPVQSITPSSFVWTLPASEATFPVSPLPTPGQSVGGRLNGNQNPTGASTSSGAVIFPGVYFYPSPTTVTIQPQPTSSFILPPIPRITIYPGQNGPTCRGSGCGSRNCGIFGCGGGGCGIFGCGGGCGIFGCGGGCGVFGCGPSCKSCGYTCPLGTCGGLGCTAPGSCGGSEGGGDPKNQNDNKKCSSSITASACTYYVSSFTQAPATTYTTTTRTSCSTSTACNGGNTATTVTPSACTATITNDYNNYYNFLAQRTNGQTIPAQFTDPNTASVAPFSSYFGFSLSSSTASCTGCTFIDGKLFNCQEVNGCTKPTQTVSTTSSTGSPTTITAAPKPTVTADCKYWIVDLWYEFEVYNIKNWLQTDYGKGLLDNERGCGAVTDWQFYYGSNGAGAISYFTLPFFISSGCVENAIAAAGGPLLQCQFQEIILGKRQAATTTTSAVPRQTASFRTQTATWTYTYTTSFTSKPKYTPANYGTNTVATITLTPLVYSSTTYTTTTVIQNGTQVSFSGSPAATTYTNVTLATRASSSALTTITSSQATR